MLDDAGRLGLRIDLTHLSGWPAGGPQVGLDDAVQNLAIASTEFSGGKPVRIALPHPRPTAADYATALTGPAYFPRGHERLMSVIATRRVGGHLSWYPFDLRDQVQLDPKTTQVLTARVKGDTLVWDAPPGRWFLVASYVMPDTERPAFSAYKYPGLVVDVLRADKIRAHYNYAFGKRTGLAPYYGGALRGIFYDSLESKANRLTSADFLREFKRRRGYDLAPYLPAVWSDGRDNFFVDDILKIDPVPPYRFGPMDDRIRNDYQQTLSDLIIERFIRTARLWGEARGLVSRGQTFGLDVDVVRAAGENSIPSTEQLYAEGGETFLKTASAGAALYGRKLVSVEAFVWENQDYATTAGKVKAAADKLFLSGVNDIVYHGTPYALYRDQKSPVGPQGWHPFGVPGIDFSENFSPATPIWADVPTLNSYIGRVQNLVRQGQPDVDVLIYYPFLGFPSGGHRGHQANELLTLGKFPYATPLPAAPAKRNPIATFLFKGLPRNAPDPRLEWLEKLQPVIDAMNRRGITWSWVNGDALQNQLVLPGGRLRAGGRYGAVLLADVDSAPVGDLKAVEGLAGKGSRVLVYGRTPQRQPGFRDAARADAEARAIGVRLARGRTVAGSPDAVATAIAAAAPAAIALHPVSGEVRRYSRVLGAGGGIHFLANQTEQPAQTRIALRGGGWWFDPLSGRAWAAQPAADGALTLMLAPFESRVLITGVPMPANLAGARPVTLATPVLHRWPLTQWSVEAGGHQRQSTGLFDWSKDPAFRYAAGPGVYRTHFTLDRPAGALRYVLEVGLVPGSVRLQVNGHDAGSASLPPGRTDITPFVKPGRNDLTIVYTPPPRNGFVGKALAGDTRYVRFKTDPPGEIVPAGLLTPIVLKAVKPQ